MAYRGRVKDMVVTLPGITGSVLQKDKKDIWAISGQAIWRIFHGMDEVWEQLTIKNDDYLIDDLEDGITATEVMQDAYIVPGLVKVDGYTQLRNLFQKRLRMMMGEVKSDAPANYFDFAYDWRRDNRASARQLKKLIDKKLPQWREYSGASDAQVILVAHSMGGLVSRYYLEMLEGWRHCKALITFGTPYRGSLDSVNFLAYGYKGRMPGFTKMARSLESLHQLLPIYKMVKSGQAYKRVSEVDFLPGILPTRAQAGRDFHKEIWEAVDAHKAVNYEENGYELVPIIGTQQETAQSVEIDGDQVRLSLTPPDPDWSDEGIADGDGTVPRISAIPLEQSSHFNGRFVPEKHAALQTHKEMLNQLFEIIKWTQADKLADVRGNNEGNDYGEKKMALSLICDDLYFPEEAVIVRAKLHNFNDPGQVSLTIAPITHEGTPLTVNLSESNGVWSTTLANLTPGSYRAELKTEREGPSPVHDLFEVAGNYV